MSKIIEIQNLKVYFPAGSKGIFSKTKFVKAVDDVSLSIEKGQTLGLVGESGCGKTTLGKTLVGLYPQARGRINYYGQNPPINLLDLNKKERLANRRKVQIIFQDPYSSLNPRMTVADILSEALIIHKLVSGKPERQEKVKELLDKVGLPRSAAEKYPHEFSGGQRQRVGIARALSLDPEFIVCDEAVSALDVSVQAQILNLLSDLQKEFSLSYLFISHDLSVIKHISHKVAVMYLGKIVEQGTVEEVFENTFHPYSKALLSAVPGTRKKDKIILEGDVPSPLSPPEGCYFHPRCFEIEEECKQWKYQKSILNNNHDVYCYKAEKRITV